MGLTGSLLEGAPLLGDERVRPCFAALRVGFKWSLYFVQVANEALVETVPGLSPRSRLQNIGVG